MDFFENAKGHASMTKDALTPRQLEAAALLASGKGVRETAEAIGVRPETVSRWRRIPGFADAEAVELNGELDQATRDWRKETHDAMWSALFVLMDELRSSNPRQRVSAAAALFKYLGTKLPTVPDEEAAQ